MMSRRVSVSRVSARCASSLFLLVVALVSAFAQNASAQSTIFNIPSTDTVSKGKGYFEIDFLPQAPGPDSGSSIVLYNPRFIVGLPNNVEVGVNFPVYHSADFDPSNLAYIQPNIKWKAYANDMAGTAVAVGVVVNAPLNSREGQGTWSYIYGNVSKKFGKDGPRVTAGPYGVIADQGSGLSTFVGTRGGVLLGYEQPLGGPVSFVADWFSSKNSLGYFTPGISVTLPHNGLFNIGYSIGNDSWENSNATKNRYLFAYYGITFP